MRIIAFNQVRVWKIHIPSSSTYIMIVTLDMSLNIDNIKSELGYPLPSLDEMLDIFNAHFLL
jgi:hypothetical protein